MTSASGSNSGQSGDWVEIPLGRSGAVALVDREDFERLSKHTWRFRRAKGGIGLYAARHDYARGRGCSVAMHREILDPAPGEVVDHINGDGLDNRRQNLRVCSQRENTRNRKLNRNNAVGFKGVGPFGARFRSCICVNGKQLYLGLFATAVEAARAYDEAANIHFGEFARLNFPAQRFGFEAGAHQALGPDEDLEPGPPNLDLFEARP